MRKRDDKLRIIRLEEGESFDDYVKKREVDKKYGVDIRGTAKLVPQKPLHYAWRFDTAPREDWSPFRKTGIGWKLKPTIILAAIFFGIPLIAYPLAYLTSGYPELAGVAFWNDFWLYLFFTLLTLYLTKLIYYSLTKFDQFLRPYGEERKKIMNLFTDKLEFVKFSVRSFEKIYSAWWIYFGFFGFLGKLIFDIVLLSNLPLYVNMLLAPLPVWTIVFNFMRNLGIDLIIFQMITFFGALIYGLFQLGSLGRDPKSLSITQYKNMLMTIIEKVIDAFKQQEEDKLETKNPPDSEIKFVGKTYFEFQRANRMIGEFLFRIALTIILFFIFFQISISILLSLNFIQSPLVSFYFTTFTFLAIILICSSVIIFIFPQLYIHKILKDFKNNLIDVYYTLSSRLEYLYYASMINQDILKDKEEWDSRRAILKDISRLESNIETVKSFGSWSYDFPNKIKRSIFVILSPLISFSIYLIRLLYLII
ncbi:MAG: hypothetical protein ACFFCC_18550 [Promethearchaeota archaeon]